jgi:Pyridine nucleotide-disulphide oxidoreductase, dimerisation domain/Pyridine nucleotide-disulphide oxidoreductase/SnoaL-like domain
MKQDTGSPPPGIDPLALGRLHRRRPGSRWLASAAGRRPNTDDLDLDKAGVRCDEHGCIIIDDRLQTTAPGIWALGDCNGKGAFTRTAYNDFEIVAANLLDRDPRRVSERITAYALYTDPPLGRVGMSLAEARNSGRRVLAGERPMTRVARAVEKGETQGLMRILIDGDSKEILGASLLGPGCDEAVHAILELMHGHAARDAHSSDRQRAAADCLGRSQADRLKIEMEDHEIRAALDRHWAASDANDFESEHEIYREDAVLEYPQSGERIRGRRNIQASRFAQPSRKRFTVRRIIGGGDLWITELVIAYDARPSYTVSIMEFRDGKVTRETQYFGDPFEPGPTRAQWVERMR